MTTSFVFLTFTVSRCIPGNAFHGKHVNRKWIHSAINADGQYANPRNQAFVMFSKAKASVKYKTTSAKLLTFADYFVPGPVQENPCAEAANRRTEELSRRYGLLPPNFNGYNTMSSYVYPTAPVDRLVCINLFMTFLYYIDDASERVQDYDEFKKTFPHVLGTVMRIIFDGHEPEEDHVLYSASRELHYQFKRFSNPEWMSRLRSSLSKHYKFLECLRGDSGSAVISIKDYVSSRLFDSGVQTMINLIEVAMDTYLPDEVLQHEHIRKLEQFAGRISWMANDIFSYEKEVMRLGKNYNYLQLLMKNKNISFEEAVDETISTINDDTRNFLELEATLPNWGDREINKKVNLYVRGLRDTIIGSYHWQLATNRYRSPDHPLPELQVMI